MPITESSPHAGFIRQLNRAQPFWLAFAVFVLVWLLSVTSAWQSIEYKGFDTLIRLSAPVNVDLPIVVVGIDEPSFADLARGWPWPRGLHAQLVRSLHRAGAAVIVFDIVFADPSVPTADQDLANAIGEAGNVVLAADLAYQSHELFEQVVRIDPLGQFLEAGAETGLASVTVDDDLVVRKLPQAEDALWRQIIRTWNRERPGHSAGNPNLPPGTLIRYLPPGGGFSYASYYQALAPEQMLPPDFFRDKVVLVGLNLMATPEPGSAQSDQFATPYLAVTGALSPGVELVAMEVANGLMDRSVTPAAPWLPLMAMVAALLVAVPGMRSWRPLPSGLLALGVITALAVLSWDLMRGRDFWLPVGAPILSILIYYLTGGAAAFVRERNRRRTVRRAFEHYVSPGVVREILLHPELLELGGQRCKLTLMFTDLAGFTSHAEILEPEQVSDILIEHFDAMAAIVMAHGGTIDKYIGDAVMAFWGAPLADEEQALHACRAGVAMQEEMARLRERFRARELPPIRMRIGIHTGEAIVGNMGASDRFDYTAVGDSVNLASRLEGINKLYNTEILATRAVCDELDGQLALWPVDIVRVKGKSQPIKIYTFFRDANTGPAVTTAVDSFLRHDWQQARDQWRGLADNPECKKLAAIYLERIDNFLREPPADDWDGSFALDKM